MKPFLTLLLDSFRMLKARVIFWITLGISILVALIYLSIGFDEHGMTFFFGLTGFESEVFRKGSPAAEMLYIGIFSKIAQYWLAWIAVLLALVSCASIFPDTMHEGAAGMTMTKRISRPGVFVAKYLGSLLFVGIQVGLFVLIVFIALRWRVGSWNPSIFWFIPLVVLVFSYLYSFLVLVAIKTRSVLTALILTMALWTLTSFVGWAEGFLYEMVLVMEMSEPLKDKTMGEEEASDADVKTSGDVEIEMETDSEMESDFLQKWHGIAKAIYAPLPKTGRTMDAVDRFLVVNGKRGFKRGSLVGTMVGMEDQDIANMSEVTTKKANRHTLFYSIGTSMIFSLVMVSLAAWSFCRRDY